MKRVYLRLIEASPSNAPDDAQLKTVKSAVESGVQIQWEMEPERHAKGGFSMSGMIPEDTDMDKLFSHLGARGYWGVI